MSGAGRVLVELRVRPRSRPGWSRDADGRLTLGVGAAPAKGAANDEARRSLASAQGIPRSRVSLVRGHRSRQKVFEVSGIEVAEVRIRLDVLGAADT